MTLGSIVKKREAEGFVYMIVLKSNDPYEINTTL